MKIHPKIKSKLIVKWQSFLCWKMQQNDNPRYWTLNRFIYQFIRELRKNKDGFYVQFLSKNGKLKEVSIK